MYIFTRLKLIKYCKTFGLIQMIQWLLDHPYHFIFARNKKRLRYFCSDALCKIKTLPGSIFRSHSIRILKYNPFRFSAIRIKKKKKKISDSFLFVTMICNCLSLRAKKKFIIDFILTFFQIHFFQAIKRIVKNIFPKLIYFYFVFIIFFVL